MDKIDFVITWVDGDDVQHQEERQKYAPDASKDGTIPTRFATVNELYFCLMSMMKFAPWVNQIHIVTDAQRPELIDDLAESHPEFAQKIILVDHKEIFAGFEQYLPNFNSLAIESMLWRVPDLAEQFVYFNDDVFLAKTAQPEDFFKDGKVVYRGNWFGSWYRFVVSAKKLGWKLARKPEHERRSSFKDAQYYAHRLIDDGHRFFAMGHTPHPARVSTFETVYQANPQYLMDNISYRFRDYRQYNPFSLAQDYDLKHDSGIMVEGDDVVFIRGGHDAPSLVQEKVKEITSGDYRYACINNLDEASRLTREEALGTLRDYLYSPSDA